MREMEIATGTALWSHSLIPPVSIRWMLIRDPEGRDEPIALLCTDQEAEAAQMVEWFVLRWTVEVTFHEVRTHLGVETQRQWSDVAILRSTPAVVGLFSLVTLLAQQLLGEQPFSLRQAAWSRKALPTFSETLADLRQHLWPSTFFRCRPQMLTPFTFREPFSIALWRRSLVLLDTYTLPKKCGESLAE